MEDMVVSNDGTHLPQLMTRPSINRESVIEVVPKLDRHQIGSKQNQKLQNFPCPMCLRVFHNCEDLNNHVLECLNSDPRVTGKINENGKVPKEIKPVKPKQQNQGEKNKGSKTAKERKHINIKKKGKGNGKGGKPALIPFLDDLVIYQGENIKLRLLLLQLGVKTAKINLAQITEGTTDIKWNRSFVTGEIKAEIDGAQDWNEYTLRKRMRDAERDVEKEIDIQMSKLKADLDKTREDIDILHKTKYKKSQPNPKFEIKTKHLKKTCNPVDIEDKVDPEMAANEEVFENKNDSDVDKTEIVNAKVKGNKTLKGTLSDKNAERYDESRRYRENSVQNLKKQNGNSNEKETSSESDDNEPMEKTLKKFMKKQLKESKQNKNQNQMFPQPPSFPFLPYPMGMPYGGFGYPQNYMQAGGYPYGMTSGSPHDSSPNHREEFVDTSNGGDSGSDPAPTPMQYNRYGGFFPAAGPGFIGAFPTGPVGAFPPGPVGAFHPGHVGGDPSQHHREEFVDGSNGGDSGSDPAPPPIQYNRYGGFLSAAGPGSVGAFKPGAVGAFPPGLVGGDPSQHHREKFVDTSNDGDSESNPAPPPMQYNPYEGFLPAAGPGSGAFLPGSVGGFAHGAVADFSPGAIGAFPTGGVRGFLPRSGAGFQSGGIRGFPAAAGRGSPSPGGRGSMRAAGRGSMPVDGRGSLSAAGRGSLSATGRGSPSPAGRGSMPGARPTATDWMGGEPGLSAPGIGGEATGRLSVDERANHTSKGLGSCNRKSVISGFGSGVRVPSNSALGDEFGFSAGTARDNGFRVGRAGFLPNGGFTDAAVSADYSS